MDKLLPAVVVQVSVMSIESSNTRARARYLTQIHQFAAGYCGACYKFAENRASHFSQPIHVCSRSVLASAFSNLSMVSCDARSEFVREACGLVSCGFTADSTTDIATDSGDADV